jgi:thiol:disulfide interchange protein DsbD
MITKALRQSLALLFLLLTFSAAAQMENKVKWKFSIEQKGEEATIIFKAKIDKGYHIYSMFTPPGGAGPTELEFEKNKNYTTVGKPTESKPHIAYDDVFGVDVWSFDESAEFRQKIKFLTKKSFKLEGNVRYQVCDDKGCIYADSAFVFDIKGDESAEATEVIATPIDSNTASIDTAATETPVATTTVPGKIPDPSGDLSKLEPGCGSGEVLASEDKSYLGIFIAGMVGGLLALLTPCVFPMIPLTVSFFTKRSPTRSKGIANALIYSVSIILIYVSLGFLVTVTLGSDALNAMASNVFFNMLFFVIFFIFALSFFGAFEITLPASWVNKADQQSDKGGLVGIFFMAFTLSLVSFSCTGPIIGTLLVEAAHGNSYIGPIAGMTGFALALALPFGLFAAFPGWLNSLPKSGGWLNSVKVVLGFLELALALKFFSNVDLAYHWGLLQREIFISLWIVIFGLMGLYLLGKIKFSHDSDMQYLGTGRLIVAILSLTFTIYLIPGLWGAPLRLISGFPPPEFYKEWIQTEGGGEHCPHNLNCYHDYEAGMAYAKQVGKPVMIDFTGWSCVNCRKMEDNVWSQPQILKFLSDDYVLISLYVDDKTPLPEEQQYVSSFTGKKIKTTGQKWSDLQSRIYKTNSQPYYILLDNEGILLAPPRGYTPEMEIYKQFLEEGICRYKNRKN